MPDSPWIVVVVRAWAQGEGRLVRMTLSGVGRDTPVVVYEPSSAAAGRRLALWLDELATSPSQAHDASENAALTPEGRYEDGGLSTL